MERNIITLKAPCTSSPRDPVFPFSPVISRSLPWYPVLSRKIPWFWWKCARGLTQIEMQIYRQTDKQTNSRDSKSWYCCSHEGKHQDGPHIPEEMFLKNNYPINWLINQLIGMLNQLIITVIIITIPTNM